MCCVSHETYPREDMLRFVAGPHNELFCDATGKLPGRGVWIYPTWHNMTDAVKKRIFAKVLLAPVQTTPAILEQVEYALTNRVLSLLGLARKSGLVAFGFEAVKKMVAENQAVMAFEASDASEREQDKLYHHHADLFVFSHFSRHQLGQIMGMDSVVHVGILNQKNSMLLMQTARKLDLFLQGKNERINND